MRTDTPPRKHVTSRGPTTWTEWKSGVGPAIQAIRVAKRMTQHELAQALGNLIGADLDQSYISHVEDSDSSVSLDRLLALCQVLDFSPPRLFQLVARTFRDSQKPPAQPLPQRELVTEPLDFLLKCVHVLRSDTSGSLKRQLSLALDRTSFDDARVVTTLFDDLLEPLLVLSSQEIGKEIMQLTLFRLTAKAWDLKTNRAVVERINRLAARLSCRVECQKCGHPALLRCKSVRGTRAGAFQFEHVIDGRRQFHCGTTKLPSLKLKLVPRPRRMNLKSQSKKGHL